MQGEREGLCGARLRTSPGDRLFGAEEAARWSVVGQRRRPEDRGDGLLGLQLGVRARPMSVFAQPGQTALTSTPLPRSSEAKIRVSAFSPAFDTR